MSDRLVDWITEQLGKRRWSVRELARQSEIHHSIISRILAGKTKPTATTLTKIANTFGESPETLLRIAGILPPSPPAGPDDDSAIQEAVELMRNLPPKQRREVLHYIRFLLHRGSGEK